MKQRLGIAIALLNNPDFVMLDEPINGLDPIGVVEIRNLIKELGKEHTVILSSHILSEVSAVCEKVIIINKGRIAAAAFTDKLISEFEDVKRLRLKIEGNFEDVEKLFSATFGVEKIEPEQCEEEGVSEVIIHTSKDIRNAILSRLVEKNVVVKQFGLDAMSLEDIFLKYVGGDAGESDI